MENARVSSKGQMIIPRRVRQALGLGRGAELAVELLPGEGFVARPRKTDRAAQVRAIAGMLSHRGRKLPAAREQAAIAAIVLAEDERTKRKTRRHA